MVSIGWTERETFDQDLKEARVLGKWIYGTRAPFGKKELSDIESRVEACLECSGSRKEANVT